MIKFNIPFYEQDPMECGLICLKMVLDFFGDNISLSELRDSVESDKRGATWAAGLVKAAALLNYKVGFYTTYLGVNPENYDLMFYHTSTDGYEASKEKVNAIIKNLSNNPKIKFKEKSLSLKEILDKLNNNCAVISEINWNTITGDNVYLGHFVVIVGYDKKYVYIHQTLSGGPQAFFPIKKKIFDKARKQLGTDENLVFIYRKV